MPTEFPGQSQMINLEENVRKSASNLLHGAANWLHSDFILLTGTAHPQLAKDMGRFLRKPVYEVCGRFPNQEVKTTIRDISVRGRDVFIIQSTCPPNQDAHIMEICQMADAAKRSSASNVTAVIPHFAYGRQDRMNQLRSPVTASLVANQLVEAGVDRIVTMDMHSEQAQGYVKIPWDNLYTSSCIVPAVQRALGKEAYQELVVASADESAAKKARVFKELIHSLKNIAVVFKFRDKDDGSIDVWDMIGDVKDSDVLVVDDTIDTATTLIKAVEQIYARGARRIWAAAAHGVFAEIKGEKPVLQRLRESPIEKIFITDTMPRKPGTEGDPMFNYVPISWLGAAAIKTIAHDGRLSDLFNSPVETKLLGPWTLRSFKKSNGTH